MERVLPLVAMLGVGCAGANPVGSTFMAGTIIAAGGVGAANVASGKCFTECPGDTVCNARTGLCDRLSETACGKPCPPGQVCDINGPIPQCVDASRRQPPPTPTGTLP
jgi:hypothetical protein